MLINSIIYTADSIRNGRTPHSVLAYTMEELGELATEVNIITGHSNKQTGPDGVVGEAVDAIICLVDLIYQVNPAIREDDLYEICKEKLLKWKSKP